jgi:hypothetical protein
MDSNDTLLRQVQDDARALLDDQLANLSQRIFEVGRQADRQLTVWLTFTALTLLFALGMTEGASLAGLQLRPEVAAAITFLLACVYYYRARLSGAALEIWRETLRERRGQRFGMLLNLAAGQGPETLAATRADLRGFIPEFPGYLACMVLIKDEARRGEGSLRPYVQALHIVPLTLFLLAPYLLAAVVLSAGGFSLPVVVAVALGLTLTLSGNLLLRFMAERAQPPVAADTGWAETTAKPSSLPDPPDG